jgi:hypothetical protein
MLFKVELRSMKVLDTCFWDTLGSQQMSHNTYNFWKTCIMAILKIAALHIAGGFQRNLHVGIVCPENRQCHIETHLGIVCPAHTHTHTLRPTWGDPSGTHLGSIGQVRRRPRHTFGEFRVSTTTPQTRDGGLKRGWLLKFSYLKSGGT